MTACAGFERSWQLAGELKSASVARRLLREALTDPLYADWLDDAQLAVSEIVTNVVLHARTDLVLTVRAEHERLCVQVRDDSSHLPVERGFDEDATTGRGMALVRELTTAFGAEPLPGGGKVVWFVLGRPTIDATRWPVTTSGAAPVAGSVAGPVALSGAAVHVTIGEVTMALVRIAVTESEAILREMLLYGAEHLDQQLSQRDVLLAEAAHTQGMAAIDAAMATAGSGPAAMLRVRIWVTPAESLAFAALSRLLLVAERLAATRQLLVSSSLPEAAALRQWFCSEIVDQVAGRPATTWADSPQLAGQAGDDAERVRGWDSRTVAASTKAVVAADAGNRIVAISASLAAALGWRVEDLVGRRLNVLVPARLRQAHMDGHRRHLMTGESRILGKPVQLPMLCSDGTELECGLVVTEQGTQVGHPVFVAAVTLPTGEFSVPTLAIGPVNRSDSSGFSDLTRFTLSDMVRMAGVIRGLSQGQSNVQAFGNQLSRYLEDQLRDDNGERQTVLVRFYATLPFSDLAAKDQIYAQRSTSAPLDEDTTCLTLLATAGRKPAWNDRNTSLGGRVMPLTEVAQVANHPLFAAVVEQTGLDVSTVLSRQEHLRPVGQRESYRQFHLQHAADHPGVIPSAFVQAHGIGSVLGFGGALPIGGSFAVMVFTDAEVSSESAQLFGTLALSASLGGFARPGMPFFHGGPRTDRHRFALSACQHLAARDEVLTMLLEVHERVAADESALAVRALERAEFQIQRYATLARVLQTSLLPPELPVIEGLESGTFFRPAGDGSEIGGDFYDVFPTSDQRWGFVLGDVSGKGAQAARLTALARHTARAAAFAAPDTCYVLERLNDAVQADDEEGRYLTALFAFVTARPHEVLVDLALGGHLQPLVLRADGQVEVVGVPGRALGLFPDPTLIEVRIVLQPGDSLIAFSDGVTEARSGDEQFGEARLRGLLAGHGKCPAQHLAAGIGAACLDFQQDFPHDDLAIVVLRCT